MARDRPILDGNSSSTGDERRTTDNRCNRRSYLKLTSGAAVAAASLGMATTTASATAGSDPAAYLESADDYNHVSFDGNWEQWFTNTHGGYVSTTTNHSRGGSALRIDWPTGEYYGATMEYLMDENHGYQPDSGHVRYWVYFPDDWEFHSDGLGGTKLPGFAGTYQTGDHDIGPGGYGGRPSDGTNGWSSRLFNCRPDRAGGRGPIGLGSQVYHAGDGGEHGAHPTWDAALETGTWHRIDQYVEMNTPGREDGVYRGWVDGDLAVEMEGLYFRDEGYGDLIGIQTLWAMFYFGGDWGSPVDQHMLFDDLEIWLWNDRPDLSDGNDDESGEPTEPSVSTGGSIVDETAIELTGEVETVGEHDALEARFYFREAGSDGWVWHYAGPTDVTEPTSIARTMSSDELAEGSEYEYYASLIDGSEQVATGETETFTTFEEEAEEGPSVTTGSTEVTDESVELTGEVETVGEHDALEARFYFREAGSDGWVWHYAGPTDVTEPTSITRTMSSDELAEGSEYEYYASLLDGSEQVATGETETFTTFEEEAEEGPSVTTGGAEVTDESVELTGEVETVGEHDALEARFYFREAGSGGWVWHYAGPTDVTEPTSIARTMSNNELETGAEYEYYASLLDGANRVAEGSVQAFTTADDEEDTEDDEERPNRGRGQT
ncbi:polysaccharide lyase [Natronorubrum tibetense]|uniref:polysaccharide lyase n=1 Tax=Natronorubrum tibetense TaxID=63128 RepID=UPI001FD5B37A|nr:polysaccharide lyase [Natronorubrum tibetense]